MKELEEILDLVEGFEEDEDPKYLYDRLAKIKAKIILMCKECEI